MNYNILNMGCQSRYFNLLVIETRRNIVTILHVWDAKHCNYAFILVIVAYNNIIVW